MDGNSTLGSHAQTVLQESSYLQNTRFKHSQWSHDSTLLLEFPRYASAASLLILSIVWLAYTFRKSASEEDVKKSARKPLHERKIFWFRITRAVTLFALTLLSIYTTYIQDNRSHTSWLRSGIVQTFAYLTLLALVSLTNASKIATLARTHLVYIALFVWALFAYRDIWPLATYTLTPADVSEGPLIWAKIALLTVVAIIVPLISPRVYIPPANYKEDKEINPIHTVSILSAALFTWLTPYIWLGNRVDHLTVDMLPPLADNELVESLLARGLKQLDPFETSNRYLFFGLMRVFAWDFTIMSMMLILEVLSDFAMPLGIYHLLNYLSGDRTDIVRPWVWIIWMAAGPILGAVAVQWYRYIATRVIILAQAILTPVLFNHSLRIRVKADSGNASGANGASGTTRTIPAKGGNLAGRLNNLISTDLNTLTAEGINIVFPTVSLPLQIGISIWFLYNILGWSAFVGMSVIIISLPIPTRMASLIRAANVEKMKRTDGRVQLVTEIFNVIRMIKLFAWEPRMHEKLKEKREEELARQKKVKFLDLLYTNINRAVPILTMIVTFASYTLIMKQQLTASRVFSAMSVFEILQSALNSVFGQIPTLIKAKVSLDRVNDFLTHTELLDQYTESEKTSDEVSARPPVDPGVLGIRQASFTWDNSVQENTEESGYRNFTLRITDEVKFKRGSINLIVGPTGSGKTSILMALLGEMHYIPAGPESYVQLPRDGGVAYATQESWVLNATIRDNIVFGAPFDEARYDAVLDQCALKRDLELFEAGDLTEVGEKGVTLSGGQKARVTLARAVYSNAEIILLDDVLAALDVHTSKWVVDKCLKGDLIKGRTVLLATHNVQLAKPVAEFAVALGTDGSIASQGSPSVVIPAVQEIIKEDLLLEEDEPKDEPETGTGGTVTPVTTVAAPADAKAAAKTTLDGKLIVAEEVSRGRVHWSALQLYFGSMAGKSPILYWTTFLGGVLLVRFVQSIQAWYLGYWSEQYEKHDPSEVNPLKYLTVYSLMLLSSVGLNVVAYIIFVYGCLRASRTIHEKLILSVLGTTLRWLDTTPVSRIISRCTADISTSNVSPPDRRIQSDRITAVDNQLTFYVTRLVELSISMIIKFIAVVVISPAFLVPGLLLAALGVFYGRVYLRPQLAVKREQSNARSPLLSHFSAAFAGLASIRAYGAQGDFILETSKRVNNYTHAALCSFDFNRWVSLRIEVLAGLFSAILATWLVYGDGASAANAGFALTMAVGFNGCILWWVRMSNELEVSANSLERIQQYLMIEQEPKKTDDGVPPAYWPSGGELVVEGLNARYSQNGPNVLHNVSFTVKSGERIGIVGRTGSGKSSLTLALLRCILTEGKVLYDGLPIDSINLDALRSNITIIPQSPELLAGTLRENLDPFAQHDDAVLNDALRASGLFSTQQAGQSGEISLDTHISSGGSNLSTGQRQIIALARALVRQSKLLLLDEATSAIDNETDGIIQTSLRRELGKDVTLLTVAHRLRTVMDADKILVLDAGSVVEYDTPANLLRRETSIFKTLVHESRDRATLYSLLRN
ncbi:hypothetical protein BC629DRAFT_1491319 [Irpex lacteus]|nr:hypothetical protein BC629DRAFT_1491319 [Irpex lacteus]